MNRLRVTFHRLQSLSCRDCVFFMPGLRLLRDVGRFYQKLPLISLYLSAFCQLTLYHRLPLPLFSLDGLCDMELTCRFGGNMMLLSCDVKVATRLPKYIHARAGMEQGSRQTSPLGLAQLQAC